MTPGRLLASALTFWLSAAPLAAALPSVSSRTGERFDLERHFAGRRRVIVLAGLGTPAEVELLQQVQTHWKRLRKRHEGVLAVVFVGKTPRRAAELCEQQGYDFPWFCDPAGDLLGPLAVDFLPTLILAAASGGEVYRATALSDALIEAIMAHPERRPPDERK